MLNFSQHRQRGISLVELLIGITVGLIVVSAALAAFVGNLRGSSHNLRQARLSEELNAVMAFMTNDIRRAGYWGAAAAGAANPFTATDTNINILNTQTCILYAYDAVFSTPYSVSTASDDGDFFGFKLSSGVVQMRTGSTAHANSSCSAVGDTWVNLTDSNSVVIDTLTFSYEGSNCLDTSMTTGTTTATSAAGSATPPCPSTASGTGFASAGHLLLESRVIKITLVGHHASDSTMTKRLESTVAVRNDRFVQL